MLQISKLIAIHLIQGIPESDYSIKQWYLHWSRYYLREHFRFLRLIFKTVHFRIRETETNDPNSMLELIFYSNIDHKFVFLTISYNFFSDPSKIEHSWLRSKGIFITIKIQECFKQILEMFTNSKKFFSFKNDTLQWLKIFSNQQKRLTFQNLIDSLYLIHFTFLILIHSPDRNSTVLTEF
jgi:hypothetical protein